jgi:hypothetical protein
VTSPRCRRPSTPTSCSGGRAPGSATTSTPAASSGVATGSAGVSGRSRAVRRRSRWPGRPATSATRVPPPTTSASGSPASCAPTRSARRAASRRGCAEAVSGRAIARAANCGGAGRRRFRCAWTPMRSPSSPTGRWPAHCGERHAADGGHPARPRVRSHRRRGAAVPTGWRPRSSCGRG